jgi:uncharacterized protein (DUF1697 family)
MARHAAFLRGINITGRHVKNDALCSAIEAMGFADVTIFRASGNVILDAGEGSDPGEVTTRVEAGLDGALGYDVPVFLRTATQVRAIDRHRPFDTELVDASEGKLQVAFLPRAPSPSTRKKALLLATAEDRLAIRGRELYWLPSGRMADATLDLKTLESLLGPWTMRTKGTIEQIAARHFAG